MWLDQWLVKQVARLVYKRYGQALQGEGHKWAILMEQDRITRLKDQLATCGDDVIIRHEAQIIAPQNIHLGHHVAIGYGSVLNGNGGIRLDHFVLLGDHCILATSTHPPEEIRFHNTITAPIHLKENVWLGAGVIILPGVTIGENAIIGAGAVVTDDIPADSVAVGVPARVIRTLSMDEAALSRQKRETRQRRLAKLGLTETAGDIFETRP